MAKNYLQLLCPSAKIEIQLKQKQSSAADYYTTGNFVAGIVSITIPRGLPLGDVQLYFQGNRTQRLAFVFALIWL